MNSKPKMTNRMILTNRMRDEAQSPIWLVNPDGSRRLLSMSEYRELRRKKQSYKTRLPKL
jgi:hypothetical protein